MIDSFYTFGFLLLRQLKMAVKLQGFCTSIPKATTVAPGRVRSRYGYNVAHISQYVD